MRFVLLILVIFESLAYADPEWIRTLPVKEGFLYFVGESRDIEDQDDALERAWVSALVRIGTTQFPELSRLHAESSESLLNSEYKQDFQMKLEFINWSGLEEAPDHESPFVKEEDGKFSVHRLLRWRIKDFLKAKSTANQKIKNSLPPRPEKHRATEEQLIDSIMKIDSANKLIRDRDLVVSKVLSRVRCGITVLDLRDILGEPDSKGANNCRSCTREYFWGTYLVQVKWWEYPRIALIKSNYGHGKVKDLCAR